MKIQIALLLVLAAVVLFSEAKPQAKRGRGLIPAEMFVERTQLLKKFASRVKRQSAACFYDIYEYEYDTDLHNCIVILGEFEDQDVVSNDTINRFCSDDCADTIMDWYVKFQRDCDLEVTQADEYLEELIRQTCKRGPQSLYCFSLWSGYDQGFVPTSYTQCLTELPTSRRCPQSCKDAISWLNKNYGCCYRALMDYVEFYDYDTVDVITLDDYDYCGQKAPDICK